MGPGEEAGGARAGCFGPDDCYGVAWLLLHLIETGPNPVLTEPPDAHAGPWRRRLWRRGANAGLVMAEEAGGGDGGAIRS
ncbi:hypothetical protein [Streptomyces sp. NPDC049915]|uniref:hypothetical protein n=1 Tax=Streptomyces sp. NPDC049915 TaxID=3155510 RepID=UPI00342D6F45